MRDNFKPGGLMTVASPLGADTLLLDTLEGSEAISELFRFTLHMRSPSTSLVAADVVGKDMTVTIAGTAPRYLSGMVTRFVQSGQDQDFALYEAELAPLLWLLTLSRNRKIFPNQGVDAVIKAVLTSFAIPFESRLAGTYESVDYCVQYDETAFDFIARLMEQAGIFYFFTFDEKGHKLVLADAAAQFADCGSAQVRFWPDTGMQKPSDTVSRFAWERSVALQKATVNDYDFTAPDTTLEGSFAAAAGSGDTYEFATGHLTVDAARALAQLRVEAGQATAEVLRGDSYCQAFTAGSRFTLTGHFVPALNTAFVLRRVQHTVRADQYINAFDAFPATVVFRAPVRTARPRAAGCETARVVGPAGEEIWTDQYGRVKVHFPWDRDAVDDTRAPWIRVAQATAGKGVGALFLPRVGHEVVISYINGDPDRPLVTGGVYNGSNAAPATLPANQTQSILRSLSSKGGSAGNELRFEDKTGAEELYLHAQKDMLVEIEDALTTTLKTGNETHTVAGTRAVAVTKAETHTNEAAFTHTVKGDFALSVDGNLTITVKGAIKLLGDAAIALEAGTTLAAKAGTALSNKAGTELLCEAGTNLTNKAAQSLLHKAGTKIDSQAAIINSRADATHTVEAGATLTLKGAMAKVN